jgi:hypothetical protein
MQNMRHELTILAYEMNGEPVTVPHGVDRRDRVRARLRRSSRRPGRLAAGHMTDLIERAARFRAGAS